MGQFLHRVLQTLQNLRFLYWLYYSTSYLESISNCTMQSAQKVAIASLTFVRKLYHPTALSLLLPFSSQLDVESLIECHSGRKSNLSSSERGWIKGPLLRTMMRRLLLNMQIQSGWSKTIDRNFFYNLSHNSVKSPFFYFLSFCY